ncbi:hypothetical protein FOZ60_008256 [Perkinsus olseni]|uniref:Uncharacterized protein n=1 Tax=Perkinsus olseni TaxID=32597 RepID=A0A7J6PE33_PEROL|nr:hypothetical protein FOZ60_008256 [Perkinsus olseni]
MNGFVKIKREAVGMRPRRLIIVHLNSAHYFEWKMSRSVTGFRRISTERVGSSCDDSHLQLLNESMWLPTKRQRHS